MKKVSILNEIDNRSFGATFSSDEQMQAWIDACVASDCWGKKERWDISEIAGRVLETREVEDVRDTSVFHTEYKLKADYVIDIVDLDQDPEYLLEQCYQARRAAYPDMADYLDAKVKQSSADPAVVAEGIAQEQAYLAACLEVKVQFPKP